MENGGTDLGTLVVVEESYFILDPMLAAIGTPALIPNNCKMFPVTCCILSHCAPEHLIR